MSANHTSTASPPTGRAIPAAVIFLGMFLFAYSVPLAFAAKPQIAATLKLASSDQASYMITAFFFAWLVVIPPFGFLADRFGRKKMLLIGSAILAVGMFLLSYADTLAMACAAQFLNGAGAIILQIVGAAVISDLFAEKRGSALTVAVGLVGVLGLGSPFLMGALLEQEHFHLQGANITADQVADAVRDVGGSVKGSGETLEVTSVPSSADAVSEALASANIAVAERTLTGISWNIVYRYSTILPVLAFLIQLFCVFPKSAESGALTVAEAAGLLSQPIFLLLVFSMLLYGIVEQGLPIWAPDFFRTQLKAPLQQQSAISGYYFIAMSLVRIVIGVFGLFKNVSYPVMIIVSSLIGAVCLAVGTLTTDLTVATIFLAALGGGVAMIWPAIMTYAVEVTGKPTSTVFGLVVGIGGALGVMIGSEGLPWIKKTFDLQYNQSLLTMELPLAVLVVIFVAIAITRPAPAKEPPPMIPETPSP